MSVSSPINELISVLNTVELPFAIDQQTLTPVAGGVVSLVAATQVNHLNQTIPVVIKHTFSQIDTEQGPFIARDRQTLLDCAADTHQLDIELLRFFDQQPQITVPTILFADPERRLTIMKDYRGDNFQLMQDLLVTGQLSLTSATQVGTTLAQLLTAFSQLEPTLTAVETAEHQADERLDELATFLRSDIPLFREIKQQFLSGSHLIPTDTHPKNMAVNNTGDVMVFDFGRSIVADPQYVVPNFAAHIALAGLGGCFTDMTECVTYVQHVIEAYEQQALPEYRLNEQWFLRYFMAELLHRGLSGRWVDARLFARHRLQEVERCVHDLCIDLFRPESPNSTLTTLDQLWQVLIQASEALSAGQYQQARYQR